MDLRRHARFLVAVAAGLVVAAVTRGHDLPLRTLLAGDTFFLTYLALTAVYLGEATASHLRERAARADEGLPLIIAASVATVALSIAAIFLLLRQTEDAGAAGGLLAAASIPLGWLMLHTLAAFHYANLFYAPAPGGGETEAVAGGLNFPGSPEPGLWDFLYFAFAIGMTAQVSDVSVRTTPLRRATLAHAVASFFYNTVILALAVNAAIALAR
jgi:uncharacterized membrane protein